MQSQLTLQMSSRSHSPISHFFSLSTAALGAFMLSMLLTNFVIVTGAGWSPTQTAKSCFRFSEKPTLPSRDEATQIMLSAIFFGSDALYFDEGEENTGLTEPYIAPSDGDGENAPQSPISEPSSKADIYSFDRSHVPEGMLPIVPFDLTYGAKMGEILFTNTTSYTVNADEALASPYPIKAAVEALDENEPLVLIIHTHGTESYSPHGVLYTSPSVAQRSADTSANMIAVGEVMATLLRDAGIPTLHCEVMHDLDSYTRSYDLAADTIQKYLTQYPSIKYVFDIHRDAIVRTNGDMIRPVTVINGESTAQIMLLVGTDEMGADHSEWRDNLTVAVQLQSRLCARYTRFARPINVRGASFNEQFTKGSLLIEIGSAANSLVEAKNAAKYLTYSIIDMIYDFSAK